MEPSIKKLPDLVYDYDVPDLLCEDPVFDQLQSEARRCSVPFSAQEINISTAQDIIVDSDIEDGDSPSYTQRRLKNKGERYQKRNRNKNEDVKPHETEDSKVFIDDFNRYLTKRSLNDSDTSTNNKAIAYLFKYHDSFLYYMLKANPAFKLSSLIAFHDSGLVELTDPVHGWTDSISGDSGNENPSRRREQLKNHAFLRDFVMVKLKTADFGTKLEDLMKKDKLKSNLEQVKRDVKDSRIWGQTKKQINQNKQKVDNAKLLVNPAQNANEAKSISVYLSSQEFRSREAKMMITWQKFENGENIGVKEFNDLANFVRHLLGKFILLILIILLMELFSAFTDRNRQGVYKLTNTDFWSRQAIWFPAGHNSNSYDGIPAQMFTEPMDKRDPDEHIIRLAGIDKMGDSAIVCISPGTNEWMLKYRQIKSSFLGDDLGKIFKNP